VGQNKGAPPSFPSVGGANDPFLAGVVEQARVRDAAMAIQQQKHSAALVAALAPRQQGGSATALLQELRSIEELRAMFAAAAPSITHHHPHHHPHHHLHQPPHQ